VLNKKGGGKLQCECEKRQRVEDMYAAIITNQKATAKRENEHTLTTVGDDGGLADVGADGAETGIGMVLPVVLSQ
jgi:hypothetical protein